MFSTHCFFVIWARSALLWGTSACPHALRHSRYVCLCVSLWSAMKSAVVFQEDVSENTELLVPPVIFRELPPLTCWMCVCMRVCVCVCLAGSCVCESCVYICVYMQKKIYKNTWNVKLWWCWKTLLTIPHCTLLSVSLIRLALNRSFPVCPQTHSSRYSLLEKSS